RKQLTSRSLILGIETSCDDTGCAIVDTEGNILGEALNSQHLTHLANGGIIPPIAQDLHRQNIENVVETAVSRANVTFKDISAIATTFKFTVPLLQYKDCNFSMAGLKMQVKRHLLTEESKHEVPPDGLIPDVNNLCAGFQLAITRHLCHRVQRGMVYAERQGLIPEENRLLVVSGGVACNNSIARALQLVCDEMDYKMARPPPKLCTDNGVMIAWNGVERWRANLGVLTDFEHVGIEKSCPLGVNISEDVALKNISCNWVKLTRLTVPQQQENVIRL
ncbi:tRNA N6-adenosine threonylcarbamoyltransferase, mitochondrial, partial [Asbolus verrucosus]